MVLSFKNFLASDSGAVAVDWVVLSASIIGIGLSTAVAVRTGTSSLASDIDGSLTSASISSLGSLGDDGYTGAWVESSGRGVAWIEEVSCPKGGIVACPSYIEHVNMTYLMEDGSYWSMQSVQPEGEEATITWFNEAGDAVDAPRFRDG